MNQPASKFNAPDLLIGIGLFLLLPLGTLAIVSAPPGGGGGPGGKPAPPLTREEVEDAMREYSRMYDQNVRLFLQRAESSGTHQSQEQAWARAVLAKCWNGLNDLRSKIQSQAATEEAQAKLPEIRQWIFKIEKDLKSLPAAP